MLFRCSHCKVSETRREIVTSSQPSVKLAKIGRKNMWSVKLGVHQNIEGSNRGQIGAQKARKRYVVLK